MVSARRRLLERQLVIPSAQFIPPSCSDVRLSSETGQGCIANSKVSAKRARSARLNRSGQTILMERTSGVARTSTATGRLDAPAKLCEGA